MKKLISEIKRVSKDSPEYSKYLDEIIQELQHIKSSYDYRKKEGRQYRKEAAIIQNAIAELRREKRKSERLYEIEKENSLNENLEGIESRRILKNWFRDQYSLRK